MSSTGTGGIHALPFEKDHFPAQPSLRILKHTLQVTYGILQHNLEHRQFPPSALI